VSPLTINHKHVSNTRPGVTAVVAPGPSLIMECMKTSVIGLLLTLASAAPAQVPAPAVIDWSADDSARVAFLQAHGRAYAKGSVTVWAPNDTFDVAWLNAFADSLAAAVSSLQSLIGGPFPWQRLGSRPIHYYLSPGRFISHADGRGGVFISVALVRRRNAPYLHEAAHELLALQAPFAPFEYPDSVAQERAATGFPFWLGEGLPDVLAQTTAAATGFPEGDVFAIGGLTKVDSVCAARLTASNRRAEILDRVGRPGYLDALRTTDRPQVAPVFYACSQSFTKHVVARIGLPATLALWTQIPQGTWRTALETAAGESLQRIRRSWLTRLGLPDVTAQNQDSVWGAALARLRPGRAIRVHQTSRGRIEGRFRSAAPAALSLDLVTSPTELSTAGLDSLWIRGNAARTGALVGAIPGAVAGVTLGVIANNVGCRDDGGDPCPEAIPLLGLAGAAGGALLGALIGSLIPKWHRRIP